MRCSYYPQSLVRICGANWEIESWIWGVDPRALFIPSCPGVTRLTGALDRADRCEPMVGFVSGNCLLVSFWLVWSCFARFCEGFSFLVGCVFEVVFVPGPRGVTKASWNVCFATAVAPDLTGIVYRSDRCNTGSKSCRFLLCVLVSFGSKGCVLVPRTSSTLVATWF
jgi:hypothetical protein